MNNKRIVYKKSNGEIAILIPSGEVPLDVVLAKDVPSDAVEVVVTDITEIPSERVFREAWELDFENKKVNINIDKAKQVAHEKRRIKRSEEFAPHDEVIAKQIPGKDAVVAEAERQKIREKYATIQVNIDAVEDVETLTTLVKSL